jgi:hypothetical protein
MTSVFLIIPALQSRQSVGNLFAIILTFYHSFIHLCLRNVKSVGLFHELPLELQDSLVVTSKRNAPESCQKFRELLWMQRECCFEKKQAARDKKVEGEIFTILWQ